MTPNNLPTLKEVEQMHIRYVVDFFEGCIKSASKTLGISSKKLESKLKAMKSEAFTIKTSEDKPFPTNKERLAYYNVLINKDSGWE